MVASPTYHPLEPPFLWARVLVSRHKPEHPSSHSVWIDSHHAAATIDAFLSVSADPTSFDDFNTTSNGTTIPLVTNFFQVKTAGEYCWGVNLDSLGIGLTNGSLVTLQVQYNGVSVLMTTEAGQGLTPRATATCTNAPTSFCSPTTRSLAI